MQEAFDFIDKTLTGFKKHTFLPLGKIRKKFVPTLKREAQEALVTHYSNQDMDELIKLGSSINSEWFGDEHKEFKDFLSSKIESHFSDQISKTTDHKSLNKYEKQIILLAKNKWLQNADELSKHINRKNYITEQELRKNEKYNYVAPYFLERQSTATPTKSSSAPDESENLELLFSILKTDEADIRNLADFHSDMLLAQDLNLYKKLKIEEIDPNKATGVCEVIIKRTNAFSEKILNTISEVDTTPEQKIKIVSFYIELAKQLADKGDFNSAFDIYLGLEGLDSKMKHTFQNLNENSKEGFKNLRKLFNSSKNYTALTARIQEMQKDKQKIVLPPIFIFTSQLISLKETEDEVSFIKVNDINNKLVGKEQNLNKFINAAIKFIDKKDFTSAYAIYFKIKELELDKDDKLNELEQHLKSHENYTEFIEKEEEIKNNIKEIILPSDIQTILSGISKRKINPEFLQKLNKIFGSLQEAQKRISESEGLSLEEALKRKPPPPPTQPKRDKGKEKI